MEECNSIYVHAFENKVQVELTKSIHKLTGKHDEEWAVPKAGTPTPVSYCEQPVTAIKKKVRSKMQSIQILQVK